MSAGAASSLVRTARALYRGPLTGTVEALAEGAISPAHASMLAAGTHDLPAQMAAEAEPVLLAAARRLDPPRLRRAVTHLRLVVDPEGADTRAERQHQQRGLSLAPTWEGMVALQGLLEPEAGQTLVAALEPWPAPPAPGARTRPHPYLDRRARRSPGPRADPNRPVRTTRPTPPATACVAQG